MFILKERKIKYLQAFNSNYEKIIKKKPNVKLFYHVNNIEMYL